MVITYHLTTTENLLRPFLEKQGYDANLIDRAVYVLTETVWLIDWQNPLNNHFAIAEEVTVSGEILSDMDAEIQAPEQRRE